jgi:hypothetical protein
MWAYFQKARAACTHLSRGYFEASESRYHTHRYLHIYTPCLLAIAYRVRMEIPILCEILAILNFLVQGPATRSVQDSDYEEYKKETLIQIAERLRYPLTTKKIKEHLLQALQARRRYPDDIFDLLLLHGTSTIDLDRQSKRQIEEHVKTLYLKDALERAARPRRARSIIPETAKQQKRALSVATSGSLQSSKGTVYSSRFNKRTAISKPTVASKVLISTLCMWEMLT